MTQTVENCCKGGQTNATHLHPDHSTHLGRLNRIKGQIEGVERMISERRYCPEIITQLRAVAAAAKSLEGAVLETHLHACVRDAMTSKNPKKASAKIEELLSLFAKY